GHTATAAFVLANILNAAARDTRRGQRQRVGIGGLVISNVIFFNLGDVYASFDHPLCDVIGAVPTKIEATGMNRHANIRLRDFGADTDQLTEWLQTADNRPAGYYRCGCRLAEKIANGSEYAVECPDPAQDRNCNPNQNHQRDDTR